jgi:hypothetical protein
MTGPIYTDEGEEYPHIRQPEGEYVRQVEEQLDGIETTWPEVAGRAWALQQEAEGASSR